MTRILVIEDDEQVRLPLVDLLEANGFEVEVALDGQEGIELATRSRPDLILSDIRMPKVDGYDVLEALQRNPKTAVIPFLFLSAKADMADVREGLGLGADDYLTKPFQAHRLLEAIRVRLKKFERLSSAAARAGVQDEIGRIFLRDGDKCWFVEYDKLRLLESEDNYVRFHFEDEAPLINCTLNEMEERLPSRLFFRANRKQMINLDWIEKMQPWFNGGLLVTLKGGQTVQMSRRSAQVFKGKMGI